MPIYNHQPEPSDRVIQYFLLATDKDRQVVEMPAGSQILTVRDQPFWTDDKLSGRFVTRLHALCDPAQPDAPRTIVLVRENGIVKPSKVQQRYLGMTLDKIVALHWFEVLD